MNNNEDHGKKYIYFLLGNVIENLAQKKTLKTMAIQMGSQNVSSAHNLCTICINISWEPIY